MATIIAFPARRMPGPTTETPAASRPAEILFFTGVRIERHAEEAPRAKRTAKRPALASARSTPRRRRN